MFTLLLLSSALKSELCNNLFIFFYCLDQKQTSLANQKVCGSFIFINYNDHANQYDALFQSFPLLCTKSCFVVCFRLQEVSGKCQQWTSGEFKTVHWWFCFVLSCVVRLLSCSLHSVICRVVMMKPIVLSPMNTMLVSCFSLPVCRIKVLDRVVCVALWCNFC